MGRVCPEHLGAHMIEFKDHVNNKWLPFSMVLATPEILDGKLSGLER